MQKLYNFIEARLPFCAILSTFLVIGGFFYCVCVFRCTAMNEHSSRSHAIFIITVECSAVSAIKPFWKRIECTKIIKALSLPINMVNVHKTLLCAAERGREISHPSWQTELSGFGRKWTSIKDSNHCKSS